MPTDCRSDAMEASTNVASGGATKTAPAVELEQLSEYRFEIRFGADLPTLQSDEGPPLGKGQGPSPVQLLVGGVCNCLCASLHFALSKQHDVADPISAVGVASIGRNAEKRLRVQRIRVNLKLGVPAAALPHLDTVLNQFEDFCTVTQSVRAAIPVEVQVYDGNGDRLR